MFRLSPRKKEAVMNLQAKSTRIEPHKTHDTKYCVCSKCRERVPYLFRRCLAVEDKNGNVKFLEKSFTLTNLCMDCVRKL